MNGCVVCGVWRVVRGVWCCVVRGVEWNGVGWCGAVGWDGVRWVGGGGLGGVLVELGGCLLGDKHSLSGGLHWAYMHVLAGPATRQGHGASAHNAGGHVTSPASMRSTKMFSERSKVPRRSGPGWNMVPSRSLNGCPTLMDSSLASAQRMSGSTNPRRHR